jgi:hypothetical protein
VNLSMAVLAAAGVGVGERDRARGGAGWMRHACAVPRPCLYMDGSSSSL